MAVFDLTDLATAKEAIGEITGTSEDAFLNRMITAASAKLAIHMRRRDAIEEKVRTEVHDVEPRQRVFRLRASPVASKTAITSVKFDFLGDFGTGQDVDSTNFVVRPQTGDVTMQFDLVDFRDPDAPQSLEFVYTGGIAVDVAGLRLVAPELEEACIQTVKTWLRRRDDTPESTTFSAVGGSVTKPAMGALPKAAMELVAGWRRQLIG